MSHRSAAARLLELRVPNPWRIRHLSLLSDVCCKVEVSAAGLSFVQRNRIKCGVSECDCEASIIRKFCSMRAVLRGKK